LAFKVWHADIGGYLKYDKWVLEYFPTLLAPHWDDLDGIFITLGVFADLGLSAAKTTPHVIAQAWHFVERTNRVEIGKKCMKVFDAL
jgi:hypothetical protein